MSYDSAFISQNAHQCAINPKRFCEVQNVFNPWFQSGDRQTSFSTHAQTADFKPKTLGQRGRPAWASALLLSLGCLLIATPASAHHPFGGNTPTNWVEGLLSGLGHPVIGPDHLVFVIAVGLLAAVSRSGFWVPTAFLGAALAGTGMHLLTWDLPAPETLISASVLLVGGILALKNRPHSAWMIGLAAIAGLFHGYAYGEAIVGAETTPLVAYLVGFTGIQLGIAGLAFRVGQIWLHPGAEVSGLSLRFAGFAISGAGAAFLSAVLLG